MAGKEIRMAAAKGKAGEMRWDDSQMRSSYANVCNLSTSRDEVVLSFGILGPEAAARQEQSVAISDRVILNPVVAKQLAMMLEAVLRDHESRYGALPDPQA
jgi:hypothetical protein